MENVRIQVECKETILGQVELVVPINDKNGSKKVKINNNIEVKQECSFYPKTGYTKNITITMNGEKLEVVPSWVFYL